MKIVSVVGARPQFIKASMVSKAFQKHYKEVKEIIIHTGQHYDRNMSDIFFDELEINRPDYNLGVGSGYHGKQTGEMLESIEKILLIERPDYVILYGDTNSTLAGALAAAKLNISVAHIEAGLRSFNRAMPEEVNRIVTDHLSNILFAPTTKSVENLLKEGMDIKQIHLVGDVMYDAVLFFATKAETKSNIMESLRITNKPYILATIHRAENTDSNDKLHNILEALNTISSLITVIFPAHPRTKKAMDGLGNNSKYNNIRFIDPVGYLDMVMLEKNASLIATDSGGVQKEAYFYKVPCVTLRSETEWVELVEKGWNHLVDPKNSSEMKDIIISRINIKGENECELYGKGNAANLIVNKLAALI